MSLVTVGLVYRNPLSTLIGARITPSTVVFQLEIGNEVTKPRIRRAENKVDGYPDSDSLLEVVVYSGSFRSVDRSGARWSIPML